MMEASYHPRLGVPRQLPHWPNWPAGVLFRATPEPDIYLDGPGALCLLGRDWFLQSHSFSRCPRFPASPCGGRLPAPGCPPPPLRSLHSSHSCHVTGPSRAKLPIGPVPSHLICSPGDGQGLEVPPLWTSDRPAALGRKCSRESFWRLLFRAWIHEWARTSQGRKRHGSSTFSLPCPFSNDSSSELPCNTSHDLHVPKSFPTNIQS